MTSRGILRADSEVFVSTDTQDALPRPPLQANNCAFVDGWISLSLLGCGKKGRERERISGGKGGGGGALF